MRCHHQAVSCSFFYNTEGLNIQCRQIYPNTTILIGDFIVKSHRFKPKICMLCRRRIAHGKRGFKLA